VAAPATDSVVKQTARKVHAEHLHRAHRADGAAAATSGASATGVASRKSLATKKAHARAKKSGENSKSPVRPARKIPRAEASTNAAKRKRAKETSQSPKKVSSKRTKQASNANPQTPPGSRGGVRAGGQACVGTPPSSTKRKHKNSAAHIDWDASVLQVNDKVLARYSEEDPLYYSGSVRTVLARKKDREQEYKIHFDDGSNKTNVSDIRSPYLAPGTKVSVRKDDEPDYYDARIISDAGDCYVVRFDDDTRQTTVHRRDVALDHRTKTASSGQPKGAVNCGCGSHHTSMVKKTLGEIPPKDLASSAKKLTGYFVFCASPWQGGLSALARAVCLLFSDCGCRARARAQARALCVVCCVLCVVCVCLGAPPALRCAASGG